MSAKAQRERLKKLIQDLRHELDDAANEAYEDGHAAGWIKALECLLDSRSMELDHGRALCASCHELVKADLALVNQAKAESFLDAVKLGQ